MFVILVEGVLSVAHVTVSNNVNFVGGFDETVDQNICVFNNFVSLIFSWSNFTYYNFDMGVVCFNLFDYCFQFICNRLGILVIAIVATDRYQEVFKVCIPEVSINKLLHLLKPVSFHIFSTIKVPKFSPV